MPNQVAILRVQTNPDPNPSFTVGGVFWLAAPVNNVNPAPFAQSQVPWVDATTLSALRAGTLVEQSFASQPFFLSTSLSGTATVTNGSNAVTFTTPQTLAAGATLTFSGQPGTSSPWTARTKPTGVTTTYPQGSRATSEVYRGQALVSRGRCF